MNGRHPDFTTSRLQIEAVDTTDGCVWTLDLRDKHQQVATMQLAGQQLSYDAIDPSDAAGYIEEALTVITAYLARTLLLPSVTGSGGEAVVWEKSGFERTDDGFSLALTH